ncbi:MAG: hypothetical protein RIF44_17355 [Nitratireductor sp.]
MKPDPRLEAHLIQCEEIAQERQRSGEWPWEPKDVKEDAYVLSQETVDGVAELIAVLQSVWREAGIRPPSKSDHENNDQTETCNPNSRQDPD